MRTFLTMLLSLACCAPLFAQEAEKPPEPPKEEKAEGNGEAEEAKDDKDAKKREMSEEAKTLFADVERVFKKYYEIVLAKVKANEPYKADDVWNEAVKEARNAKYKDSAEFHAAITNMKRKDRVFKKDVMELANRLAKEHAEAVEKWSKEK